MIAKSPNAVVSFLFQKCTKDSDCGEGRCCLNPNYFGFCTSKPGIDDSCNLVVCKL